MAIIITDECINCGACEPECPNNAIYEGGIEWAIKDGTLLLNMMHYSPLYLMITILSYRINALNVLVFTKNLNALQFALWIAASLILIVEKAMRFFSDERKNYMFKSIIVLEY